MVTPREPAATTTAAPTTTEAASGDSTATTTGESTASTTATTAGGSTATTLEPPATLPAPTGDPVYGGKLVVAGEAEVGAPWTPAAVQCDSYCQFRIRTFIDPLFVTGDDRQVHPFLGESITPNADYTQWTIKVRPGISSPTARRSTPTPSSTTSTARGPACWCRARCATSAKDPDGKILADRRPTT